MSVLFNVTIKVLDQCAATLLTWCMDRCALEWRLNGRDGVSNHQPSDCLLGHLSRHDERKHQSSASLALLRGIHRWPVNIPHKGQITRNIFTFDDVTMSRKILTSLNLCFFSSSCISFNAHLNTKLQFKMTNPLHILHGLTEDTLHIRKLYTTDCERSIGIRRWPWLWHERDIKKVFDALCDYAITLSLKSPLHITESYCMCWCVVSNLLLQHIIILHTWIRV